MAQPSVISMPRVLFNASHAAPPPEGDFWVTAFWESDFWAAGFWVVA